MAYTYSHPTLPKDGNSAPIQALYADEQSHVQTAITGTASAIVVPTGAKIIEINTDIAVCLKSGAAGQSAATTSSRYLPAGSYVYAVAPAHVEISMIRYGSVSGICSITTLL